MPTFRFDSIRGIIAVTALASDGSVIPLQMALDTGASRTAVRRGLAFALGFDPDLAPRQDTVATASGVTNLPVITLPRLRALGYEARDLTVSCLPLPREAGVDGLLGSDFLSRFHIFINYRKGLLVVREAQGLLSRLRFWLEVFRSL